MVSTGCSRGVPSTGTEAAAPAAESTTTEPLRPGPSVGPVAAADEPAPRTGTAAGTAPVTSEPKPKPTSPDAAPTVVALPADAWIYTEPSPKAFRFRMERTVPPADHRAAAKLPSYESVPRRVLALSFDKDLGNGWFQVSRSSPSHCGYRSVSLAGPLYVRSADLLPVLAKTWRSDGRDGTIVELDRSTALRPAGPGMYRAENAGLTVEIPSKGVTVTRRVQPPPYRNGKDRPRQDRAKGPVTLTAAGRRITLHSAIVWVHRDRTSGRDRLDYDSYCARVVGHGTFRGATDQDWITAPSSDFVRGGVGKQPSSYAQIRKDADVFLPSGTQIGSLGTELPLLVRHSTKVKFKAGRACLRHAEILGVHAEACIDRSDYTAAGMYPTPAAGVAVSSADALDRLALYRPDPTARELERTKSATVRRKKRTITTSFCIDESGSVVDVSVSRKSGDDTLDTLVADTIARWRFRAPKRKTCAKKTYVFRFDLQ